MDVSRPIVYSLGILLITIFIIQVFYVKLDQNVQAYIDNAVNEFVDDTCATGYISPEKYLLMTGRINNTGNVYELTLTHEAKVVMPYVSEDGTEKIGSYVLSNVTYNKQEILDEMFPINDPFYYNYPLNSGDNIKVTVSLIEPTPAGRIFSYFSGKEVKTIAYSYGGYVGSKEDNGIIK